ncbi:MAG: SurA N-terminal domain-containing protein [Planctomycetota bacterium]
MKTILIAWSATLALMSAAGAEGVAADSLPEGTVATVSGEQLLESEFHAYVGREYRFEARATELLQLMIQQQVVLAEAEKQSLGISDRELELRLKALDVETSRQTGGERNLQSILDEQGITREEFLPSLRISLLAEELVRGEFQIPAGREVPYEKTHLWIQDRLGHATVKTKGLPPEIVVSVNGQPIGEGEFGRRYLMDQRQRRSRWQEDFIDTAVIRQAATARDIRLTREEVAAAIEKRRQKVRGDSRYRGASLEELLEKTGRDLDWFRSSAELRNQILLEKMVRAEYPDGGLHRYYMENLGYFDEAFGPSAHLRCVMLKAGHEGAFSQGFVPRLFADAEAELTAMRDRISAGKVTLAELAATRSEHPSRDNAGDLGYVDMANSTLGELARDALTDRRTGVPIGPVRTAEGVFLYELLGTKPKPEFSEIEDEVLTHAAAALFARIKAGMEIQRREISADR